MHNPFEWKLTIHVHDQEDYYLENKELETITLSIPASAGSADEVLEKVQLAVIRGGFHDGYRLRVTVGVDEHGASGFTREIVLIIAAWSFGKIADPLWDQIQAWIKAEYQLTKDAPDLRLLTPEQKTDYYENMVRTRYKVEGELVLIQAIVPEISDIAIFKDGNGTYYRITPEPGGTGITIESNNGPF